MFPLSARDLAIFSTFSTTYHKSHVALNEKLFCVRFVYLWATQFSFFQLLMTNVIIVLLRGCLLKLFCCFFSRARHTQLYQRIWWVFSLYMRLNVKFLRDFLSDIMWWSRSGWLCQRFYGIFEFFDTFSCLLGFSFHFLSDLLVFLDFELFFTWFLIISWIFKC